MISLFRMLMVPLALVAGAGLLAVGVVKLDETTPLVDTAVQQLPVLEGPVKGVKSTGTWVLQNAPVLTNDVRQTLLPDPQTRTQQERARKRLGEVNNVIQAKHAQIQALQQELESLEHEQTQLDVTAHPLKKWITQNGNHTRKEFWPFSLGNQSTHDGACRDADRLGANSR